MYNTHKTQYTQYTQHQKNKTQTKQTQVGPANLRFTLPMHCASGLALRYLQILKKGGDPTYSPQRWVRYVTTSSSYVFRT